ncbi:uncharacterized protein LOC117639272 [Thrips palmi]|uniref:Uncharacterized protein LOC117639272 n=1 Tax=Thrips palmi TaxID=161013 RepID=A0A6P8YAE1_THRPL|nr:uncharacterized protein LOC117639272 [Thrips palmi]XP_034230801.1 uncharacterized protein LOC117639272 [Thrips palmi]
MPVLVPAAGLLCTWVPVGHRGPWGRGPCTLAMTTTVATMASTVAPAVVDFAVSDWSDLDPHFTQMCSDATLQSDRRGFFLDLVEAVTDGAGIAFVEEFAKLKDDRQRLETCYSHPKVRDAVRGMLANVQPVFRSKAADVASQRRLEGERILRGGNSRGALTTLSQAVMRAPAPAPAPAGTEPLLALALWARSEALLQLRHFQQSLDDVQHSLRSGLPESRRLEAFYRMGLCQHGLGDTKKAGASLQVAGRLLEKVADKTERTAWTATIQQAMGALRVPRPSDDKARKSAGGDAAAPPPLAGGQHHDLPAASSLLRVSRTKTAGRQMEAAKPIRTGDTLVVESPEAACLLPDKFGTHCLHCFGRLLAPVACETCSGVAFCGHACLQAAKAYHGYECRHLGLLLGSGMSVLCHLALRAVTQRGLAFFRGLREHLAGHATKPKKQADLSAEQQKYLKMYYMEAHAQRRSGKDFLQRSVMALFLLRILQESGFFPKVSDLDGDLNEDELLVGAVLLRHLQILQFNAHEVYETVIMPRKEKDLAAGQCSKFRSAKIMYIGVAVYPTVALFNHDCYPAVTRYFRGRDIVVTAVRPLAAGDVVAENYGPIFTKRSLAQRQRTLNSRYWFRCGCNACAEDWPLMEHLLEDDFRFRCPAEGCPQTMRAPRAQDAVAGGACPRCGVDVDLAGVRPRLEACRGAFDAALEAMERDEPRAALPWLCRFLDDMHALTKPPVRTVSLAQEALRTCLADGGNVWTVP